MGYFQRIEKFFIEAWNKSTSIEGYENIYVKLSVARHASCYFDLYNLNFEWTSRQKEIQAFLTLSTFWMLNLQLHIPFFTPKRCFGENCVKFSEFSLYNSKDLSSISSTINGLKSETGVSISSSCKGLAMTNNTVPFLAMGALYNKMAGLLVTCFWWMSDQDRFIFLCIKQIESIRLYTNTMKGNYFVVSWFNLDMGQVNSCLNNTFVFILIENV